MRTSGPTQGQTSVSIKLGSDEGRLEKVQLKGGGEGVRFSAWSEDQAQPEGLELAEADLIVLLHKAIHAGVLSPDFMGNLRAEIEI